MIKCKICKGQKFVQGMGNMREKCKECNGKGFVSDIESPKVKSTTNKKSKDKENV